MRADELTGWFASINGGSARHLFYSRKSKSEVGLSILKSERQVVNLMKIEGSGSTSRHELCTKLRQILVSMAIHPQGILHKHHTWL